MDVTEHDARAGARLAELVAGVPADAWESATPCPDWTVHDLVTHLVAGNVKYRDIAAWMHLAETLGHGWDLATATGQPPDFDDDAVAACLAECQGRIPPERPAIVTFADAVTVEGGSLIDQLAAYLGRTPTR